VITKNLHIPELAARLQLSVFSLGEDAVEEAHAFISIDANNDTFEAQVQRIYAAEDQLFQLPELQGANTIFKRYFLTDATNQVPFLRQNENCTVSYIQQPPLDGSKVTLWLYLQKGTRVSMLDGTLISEHNGYRHLWTMGLQKAEGSSYEQTLKLLNSYENLLDDMDATLADNCIRTWFFVRDVDTQYAGMVRARRDNFFEQGLTRNTHYIASTGIGGTPSHPLSIIQLGAYALTGFDPQQQQYLYARTHLNPTYEYGVTFERGVCLHYGDRNHVYISGTASINNKGEVMYEGDIVKQTHRMWENVETLLAEAEATYDDVMQIIVYLRDLADVSLVKTLFQQKFPHTPYIITLAPVCRPTWLIEMECIAVKKANNPQFRPF
jgi:enamine deaminase RidA (YjgF/YER057c/UK114 family)